MTPVKRGVLTNLTTKKTPRIRSVKFNVVMNMIVVTSSFLFPLITVPYVSRVLSPTGMGAVSWAQSILSYFSLVALLGIPSYGIRECAKVRNDPEQLSQLVQELLTILLFSTIIVYAAFIIAIFCIPRMRQDMPTMLIFSITIWLSACGVEWFYQAIEQYAYITVRNLIMKAISLVLMFLLIHSATDYRAYAVILVIGSYGSNLVNVWRLRKFVTFKMNRKLNLRKHFKPMLSFAVSKIASGLYAQMDIVLVGFTCTNVAVGLYQLVVKIKGLCVGAVNSVSDVMLPRLSYYKSNTDGEKLKDLVAKNLNFLTILGLSLMSIIAVCAQPIVLLIAGTQYARATPALMAITPVILFSALNSFLSQLLIIQGQEKTYASINLLGLICSIIVGLLLIPRFNIMGAALSITTSELLTLIIRIITTKDMLFEVHSKFDIGKIFFATLFSFAALVIIHIFVRQCSNIVQLILCTTTYLCVDLFILIITKEKFITNTLEHAKSRHSCF
ncbi:flippase [Bifidobacterium sp. ESL0769]|uniref:flippase n=1 Tax=Bifidobacterium sp. ESL0769 TaxID=2983229 RepID=UPI0023F97334|nr:flippase [Bifidobacterium sp. ESL0769]WEV67738.1 flippase [Bifidobacterium sp. ESL0769]